MKDLRSFIRDIPDFPRKGILFKDITPLLQNADAFQQAVEGLAALVEGKRFDCVASIEARGFVFGGALASQLGIGFVPVRKKGKFPYRTRRNTYTLEYGEDTVEIHDDAFQSGQRVLVLDDLLATGGTAKAVTQLIESCGAKVECLLFLIELAFLKGRAQLNGYEVLSLIRY